MSVVVHHKASEITRNGDRRNRSCPERSDTADDGSGGETSLAYCLRYDCQCSKQHSGAAHTEQEQIRFGRCFDETGE